MVWVHLWLAPTGETGTGAETCGSPRIYEHIMAYSCKSIAGIIVQHLQSQRKESGEQKALTGPTMACFLSGPATQAAMHHGTAVNGDTAMQGLLLYVRALLLLLYVCVHARVRTECVI